MLVVWGYDVSYVDVTSFRWVIGISKCQVDNMWELGVERRTN